MTTTNKVGDLGPGLGQAHEWGGIKLLLCDPNLLTLDNFISNSNRDIYAQTNTLMANTNHK